MCVNDILYDKRYGNPSVEVLRKILKSKQEAEMLPKRTIRCPICGFKLEEAYGYGASYVQVKCRKCKFEQPLNAVCPIFVMVLGISTLTKFIQL